jgi:AbrB family looped-hinge helix DNA binding protein
MTKQEKREVAVVTSKGQLVIPARLRRRFGIKQGTSIVFYEEDDRLIMQPVTAEFVRRLRGSARLEPSQAEREK